MSEIGGGGPSPAEMRTHHSIALGIDAATIAQAWDTRGETTGLIPQVRLEDDDMARIAIVGVDSTNEEQGVRQVRIIGDTGSDYPMAEISVSVSRDEEGQWSQPTITDLSQLQKHPDRYETREGHLVHHDTGQEMDPMVLEKYANLARQASTLFMGLPERPTPQ